MWVVLYHVLIDIIQYYGCSKRCHILSFAGTSRCLFLPTSEFLFSLKVCLWKGIRFSQPETLKELWLGVLLSSRLLNSFTVGRFKLNTAVKGKLLLKEKLNFFSKLLISLSGCMPAWSNRHRCLLRKKSSRDFREHILSIHAFHVFYYIHCLQLQ